MRDLVLWTLLLTTVTGASGQSTPGWWLSPQRMIQTNLREIDASMDLDA